jgi:hypothetical protein
MQYSERLQILVTKRQRDRWSAEARRRGTSVGAIVRESVDAQLGGGFSRDDKLAALEQIKAMNAGPMPSPEELNRTIEDARTADILAGIPGLPDR